MPPRPSPAQRSYEGPRKVVREAMESYGLKPMTYIWVKPFFPNSWRAEVGTITSIGELRVYIFIYTRGRLRLRIEPLLEMRKNGTLVY